MIKIFLNPLRQKSTPPTWRLGGPFSDLTSTSAGVCDKSKTVVSAGLNFLEKIIRICKRSMNPIL